MSDLKGPNQSKSMIASFEYWLSENCKDPKPTKDVKNQYQYETGHARRKLVEYLEVIESVGKIKIFHNAGKECCQWVKGAKPKMVEPEEIPDLLMPEEQETVAEYAKKKEIQKAREEFKRFGKI